jgi:hypothetical protein
MGGITKTLHFLTRSKEDQWRNQVANKACSVSTVQGEDSRLKRLFAAGAGSIYNGALCATYQRVVAFQAMGCEEEFGRKEA